LGALMRQIISIIYGVLLIAIWICVMGIVIAVLDSRGPKWLLLAGGFVAAVSTVALVEEFVERHSGPRTTKSSLEQRSI
jgi:bacteriorhodopsin